MSFTVVDKLSSMEKLAFGPDAETERHLFQEEGIEWIGKGKKNPD